MWGELFPAGDPFSTGHLIVLDTIRVIVMAASLGIAAFALPIARHVRNSRQFGCYALACYALFATVFQFTRLGHDTVSPALFLVIAGGIFGALYCRRVSREIRSGKYAPGGKYHELHNPPKSPVSDF